MRSNFHETYAGSEVKPPSERSVGLLFAGVALIFAALWRHSPTAPWVALGVAMALLAASLTAPALLRPINLLWFQFELMLHRIVSPVVMFLMFAVVFVPSGAIMRLWSDPLRLRRPTPGPSSYWVERSEIGDAQSSMTAQF